VSLFSGFTLGGSWLRRSLSPRAGVAKVQRDLIDERIPLMRAGEGSPPFDHGRFVQTRVERVQPLGVGSCQRHDRVEKGKVTLKEHRSEGATRPLTGPLLPKMSNSGKAPGSKWPDRMSSGMKYQRALSHLASRFNAGNLSSGELWTPQPTGGS